MITWKVGDVFFKFLDLLDKPTVIQYTVTKVQKIWTILESKRGIHTRVKNVHFTQTFAPTKTLAVKLITDRLSADVNAMYRTAHTKERQLHELENYLNELAANDDELLAAAALESE